jgi:5'-nucleotidase
LKGELLRILLTNDDGVYAPGISALHHELKALGQVSTIAPATEQSGVGHSITFLEPLVCKRIYDGDQLRAIAVEGSPADCVKLGVSVLLDWKVDAVVSGINGGLNAGINVLYSGTVAAAIEGAFFRLNSFAISLEYDPHADFSTAAKIAVPIIKQILDRKTEQPHLYNINVPTAAIEMFRNGLDPEIKIVPMGVERYGEHFICRQDPKGRDYYWATNDPPPLRTEHPTDLTALADGHVTVTPLKFDLTDGLLLQELGKWELKISR